MAILGRYFGRSFSLDGLGFTLFTPFTKYLPEKLRLLDRAHLKQAYQDRKEIFLTGLLNERTFHLIVMSYLAVY